jgi:cytosine deaminase
MCSGTVLLYNISRVVIGENTTLIGPEKLLKDNGVEVTVMQIDECRELLEKFIEENTEKWEVELEKVGFSTD